MSSYSGDQDFSLDICLTTYAEQQYLPAQLLRTGQIFSDNFTFHYKSEQRKQLYAIKGKKTQASQLLIKITLK